MNIGDDKELIGYADSKNMEWQEYRPGSRSKILREDTRSGQLTMLARWEYRMSTRTSGRMRRERAAILFQLFA